MSDTGRYFVRAGGRLFCVEPIDGRVNESKQWRVGGVDEVRGGSVPEGESIITVANGFTNIKTLPPGVSPEDYLNELLSARPDTENSEPSSTEAPK